MLPPRDIGLVVNDVHPQLTATRVAAIVQPRTIDELCEAVRDAQRSGRAVSIAGGRHAMGGQQFGESALLVDTRALDRVLDFDAERGIVTVEGGTEWPALIAHLNEVQVGRERQWGIYQKQTGADRLSLAGALSSNAHGRGLLINEFYH